MEALNVLIGSDPELFVGNADGVSFAIGRVGGTKEEPIPVAFGALQEDNVLLEYNIDPAPTLEEFRHNILVVRDQGADVIRKFDLSIVHGLSSHIFDPEVLDEAGEQAWIFGCEPDYNAWTGAQNVFPQDVNPFLRTAGGHLHIGYGHLIKPTKAMTRSVIQMCDYLLGLPSVLMDPDDRRKALYGKAGAMRYKKYGGEYRTLSNFWLFSNELIDWAYQGSRAAFERVDELPAFKALVPPAELQRIINEGDKEAAKAAIALLDGVVVL